MMQLSFKNVFPRVLVLAFPVLFAPLACQVGLAQSSARESTAVSIESAAEPPTVSPPALDSSRQVTATSPTTPKPYSVLQHNNESEDKEPWDYSPYRVLVWLASEDPSVDVASIERSLRNFLDRDFASLWRVDIENAPRSVRTAASRGIDSLSYDLITGSDPVLAVKRDHKDAVRIRTAKLVGEFCEKIHATAGRIASVKRQSTTLSKTVIDGVFAKFTAVDGDAIAVTNLWSDKKTEALLVSRGMALTLTEPQAKLVSLPVSGMVVDEVDRYDKIFVVHVRSVFARYEIDVVELDTLMRHFGPVARMETSSPSTVAETIGHGLIKAFAPIVRIDNAGHRNAVGLLRAGGLILDENSPAGLRKGDVLEPMTRKNDPKGKPIQIGLLDWAYLVVEEFDQRKIKMEFYAGRMGGLQGRKNKRTFRRALKVRPFRDSTLARLHLQKDPDFPLIGYELYQKELKSKKMTFVGRTDWNGRLMVDRNDDLLRLFYVKNGGAVLARLPVVPGLYSNAVADLSGDDMRLQAEAYIRGVQNSIIDLVAVRELFKARIRLRLRKGEMDKAEDLMNALRQQPSNEKLANALGKKQSVFLKALGRSNARQRRKVDFMFTETRELLGKHINPRLVRELESDMITARNNGGKLPPEKEAEGEGEEVAEQPSADE